MKINFNVPTDHQRHFYCANCNSEGTTEITVDEKTKYTCNICKETLDRRIDLDPKIKWWVDKSTKELWHESVGIFVQKSTGEYLFIERIIYPYGFTIPAGHLDVNELPEEAAIRELFEETGIKASKLSSIFEGAIEDKCRKGADYHFWHLYKFILEVDQEITPDISEGKQPVWLTTSEAIKKELTGPTKYFLENLTI